MRRVKLLTLAVAFLAIPSALSAQGFADAGIGFFGGVALPNGDFADNDGDEESGFAELGFMVGADAHLPLGTSPLGWVTSVSINSFGVDDDLSGPDGDVGRYWLIPITTGVNYPIDAGGMAIIPMAQIGLNLAMGPSGEDAGGNEFEFGTAFSLAFSAGADVMFMPNLGATIRYVNGGAPEREIESDFGDADKDSPMSWLQLGLVYRFR